MSTTNIYAGTGLFGPPALAVLLLAAAPVPRAGGTPWAAESAEQRLSAAAGLAAKGLEHEALSVYLDILKTSPGDKQALKAMKELSERAAASAGDGGAGNGGGAPAAQPDGARLYGALDEAALAMLDEVAEPELRLGFAKARRLFNEGGLLPAYDAFLLLESRKPSQDWLRDEIRRYLRDRIPRELDRGRVRGLYGLNADLFCRHVFAALAKRDWDGVYKNLGLWLNMSAGAGLPQGEKRVQEAESFMARLKARIALARTGERGEPWLDDARRAFMKQDYAGAADLLETFIPAAAGAELSARAWKELGAAYDYGALQETVGKTERAMADGQYSRAFMLIADALGRYPGSRRMTELRNALFERARPAERGRPAQVASAGSQAEEGGEAASEGQAGTAESQEPRRPRPARPAAKAAAEAPPAPPRVPTDAERAEADALYLQGISAYGTGDLEKARNAWAAALRLAPDHQKSLKGLERLAAETKAGR